MASEEAVLVVILDLIKSGIPLTYALGQSNIIEKALDRGVSGPDIVSYYEYDGTDYERVEKGAIDLDDRLSQIDQEEEERQRKERLARETQERQRRIYEGMREAGLPVDFVETPMLTDSWWRTTGLNPYAGDVIPASAFPPDKEAVGISAKDLEEFENYLFESFNIVPTPDGRYLAPDGRIYTYEQIIAGGATASFGTGARTATYTTDVINGQVYRISSLDGIPVPTGIMVDPTITSTQVDSKGNLVGLKSDDTIVIIQEGFDFPKADPNKEIFVSALDGKTYERDLITKEITELGQFNWATIDPERTFAEEQRQFDTSESRLLESMRRERGLEESQFIGDVLSRPADFLARAFLSRGQTPIDTPLTQADIINNLRTAISSASGGAVTPQGAVVGTPGTPSPVQQFNEDAFNAANQQRSQLINAAIANDPNVIRATESVSAIPTGPMAARLLEGRQSALLAAQEQARQAAEAQFAPVVREQFMVTQPAVAAAPAVQTATSPLMMTTQDEIRNLARQYSSPAVSALLESPSGTESLQGISTGFRPASPRQTSRLTQDETQALGTRLAAEGTSLEDYAKAQEQLFGATRTNRRGRLVT